MSKELENIVKELNSLEGLYELNDVLSRSDKKRVKSQIEILKEKIKLISESNDSESNISIKKRKRSNKKSKHIINANGKFNKLANELNSILLKGIIDKKKEYGILSNKIDTMKIQILSHENPISYNNLVSTEKKLCELIKKNNMWKTEMENAQLELEKEKMKNDNLNGKKKEFETCIHLIKKKRDDLELIVNENKKEYYKIKATVKRLEKKNNFFIDQILEFNKKTSNLEENLKNLKEGVFMERYNRLKKEYFNYKNNFNKLKRIRVNYDFRINSEKEKIEEYKNLVEQCEKQKKNLEEKHGKIESINKDIESYNTNNKKLDNEIIKLTLTKKNLKKEVYCKNLEIERQKKENNDLIKNRDIICTNRMKSILENHKCIMEEKELFIGETTKRISNFIQNGENLRESMVVIEESFKKDLQNLQNKIKNQKKIFNNKFSKLRLSIEEEMLICPISQDLIKDPVLCEDGHIYEKDQITSWWNTNKTSPITRNKISKPGSNVNGSLIKFFYKSMVDSYKKKEKKSKISDKLENNEVSSSSNPIIL